MSYYRFAQLFVKLSRAIGVIVFVLGFLYVASEIYGTILAMSAATYKESKKLSLTLNNLAEESRRTLSILKAKGISDIPNDPIFATRSEVPTSSGEFEKLFVELEEAGLKRLDLKEIVIRRYEESVNAIRAKLVAHGKEVSEPKSKSETKAPKRQSSSSETTEMPGDHIFADLSEIGDRKFVLEQAQDILETILKEAQQEESKRNLRDAVYYLKKLASLVPSVRQETSDFSFLLEEERKEPETEVQAEEMPRSIMIAMVLEDSIRSVRTSILQKWAIDEVLDAASLAAADEMEACETAKSKKTEIARTGTVAAISRVIVTVFLSFMILVVADFLQTQLDIAKNTSRMSELMES